VRKKRHGQKAWDAESADPKERQRQQKKLFVGQGNRPIQGKEGGRGQARGEGNHHPWRRIIKKPCGGDGPLTRVLLLSKGGIYLSRNRGRAGGSRKGEE